MPKETGALGELVYYDWVEKCPHSDWMTDEAKGILNLNLKFNM